MQHTWEACAAGRSKGRMRLRSIRGMGVLLGDFNDQMWARKGTCPWQGWLISRKLLDMAYQVGDGEDDITITPTGGGRRLGVILVSPGYA